MATPVLHRALRKKLRKLRKLISDPDNVIRRKHNVHHLRVRLKQWRAALRLLQAIDSDFPGDAISREFNPVFVAAGRVRFWQLQRSFLSHTKPLAHDFIREYRAYLCKRLRRVRSEFRAVANHSDWPRWRELKRDVRHACEACDPESLHKYFAGLQQDIRAKKALLSRRRKPEMHALRKILSEYSANRKLVARELGLDPGPLQGLAPGDSGLQSLLGDWHDQSSACEQLAADLHESGWVDESLQQGRAVLRTWKKTERKLWNRVITELARK